MVTPGHWDIETFFSGAKQAAKTPTLLGKDRKKHLFWVKLLVELALVDRLVPKPALYVLM